MRELGHIRLREPPSHLTSLPALQVALTTDLLFGRGEYAYKTANVLDQRRAGITLAKVDDAVRRVLCIVELGVIPGVLLAGFVPRNNE